ncbi:MAG: LLM class flavin-dependent oxidoreductase [Halieaceae bacterium]|jgi:alkanesulfonate monooxygenase SsuD/methylene tetrahydromethanopterin reductase-like flavin-dependent oxidoreductase (luciferase family)|nr:LLM class flavin-dependent oxidoreductase [Halieaceae bacterium]
MEVVLGPFGMQSPHPYRRSHADMYEDLITTAQKAEEFGYDGIALTEHSFWYDGYCPSLQPTLASVAQHTSRIKLVTGALLLPQHDPLKVAEEAAVLDRLSHGRLVLGLGVGYRPEEFHGHGVEIGRMGARFLEAYEVVRRALTQETFSYEGEFYQYHNVSLKTRPWQQEIPMWVCAGFTEWSIKAAARRGWSYCTTGDMDGGGAIFQRYDEFAESFGHPPEKLKRALFRDVFVMPTQEEADIIMEQDYWAAMNDQFFGFGFLREKNPDGSQMTEVPPPMKEMMLNNRLARPRGTPAMVREHLAPILDWNIDMLIARMNWANFTLERGLRSAEVFARDVMPMLRQTTVEKQTFEGPAQ